MPLADRPGHITHSRKGIGRSRGSLSESAATALEAGPRSLHEHESRRAGEHRTADTRRQALGFHPPASTQGDQVCPLLSGRGMKTMPSSRQRSSRCGSAEARDDPVPRAVSAATQSARLTARFFRW